MDLYASVRSLYLQDRQRNKKLDETTITMNDDDEALDLE